MKFEDIKKMVETDPSYDFLRTNPHLGERVIFLTLGGSYSYGTNTDSSDIDVRGCTLNRKTDLIGLTNFEQFVNTATDTTVYSFNKLVKLLLNCNPNTIEMLGCRPDHYLFMTPIGEQMIANRKLFISRRAADAFGGYATQQLRRLENALARDKLPQAQKEEHIRQSMEGAIHHFEDKYTAFENGSFTIYTDVSPRDDLDREIFGDIHLTKYPVRQFNGMMNDLKNVLDNYEKLNHRNHKKDDNHLNKHAMHLIRLYLIVFDIFEKGDIITYREKDLDLLRGIRRGDYMKEDGTYRDEFFEMLGEFEKKLAYMKENSDLPEGPDMEAIEEFVMEVNRKSLDM